MSDYFWADGFGEEQSEQMQSNLENRRTEPSDKQLKSRLSSRDWDL
jgi:hypothetical protein